MKLIISFDCKYIILFLNIILKKKIFFPTQLSNRKTFFIAIHGFLISGFTFQPSITISMFSGRISVLKESVISLSPPGTRDM